MIRSLACLLVLALMAAADVTAGGGPASVLSPVRDDDGIVSVSVHCRGAPNTAVCSGHIVVPRLDEESTSFRIAPGKNAELRKFIPGPLHARVAKLKALTVELTQVVDGQEQTATHAYRLVYSASGPDTGGGGPASDAPAIAPGPATRYTVVHDARGDAHSSFPLPQLFDIVFATARRKGDAAVLTVVSTAAITRHDSYGNPVAPCVAIPWASATQYPMFLFPNGQLSGYSPKFWPKMKTTIHGATISWTLPRTVLARKGFARGFLWRASGGCDAHHLADLAPDHGFATFRWTKVYPA